MRNVLETSILRAENLVFVTVVLALALAVVVVECRSEISRMKSNGLRNDRDCYSSSRLELELDHRQLNLICSLRLCALQTPTKSKT